MLYQNKKPGFSVAGKPGNPTAYAAIANWLAIIFCNCLFTTLVTRVGYLLLQYFAPVETSSAP